ncbi:MAG TPA: DUF1080 domain-containing protein [Terriglobia bacterium]|nr:DUF1080 domain-containing protein [Terriglobia bacterium]
MKVHKLVLAVIIASALCSAETYAANFELGQRRSAENAALVQSFLGRWDLTLKTPKREQPSWLEIYRANGELKANMVGRWGSAHPLSKVDVIQDTLTFTSPKEYENRRTDMEFKGKLVKGRLVGTTTGPDGAPWTWAGQRAPLLIRSGSPRWGAPVDSFDGKDLNGWHEYSINGAQPKSHWKVVQGTLVSPGQGDELVNTRKFEDFKLHVEFKLGPDSNSGVYLRGRDEVQIENESMNEPPSHHTGGVYGFLAPTPELPRTTGKWQTFDITLVGRNVTVVENGTTIINHKEIPGITGGALDSHEGMPGPIYLQGSEKGHVAFRNIVITPAVE